MHIIRFNGSILKIPLSFESIYLEISTMKAEIYSTEGKLIRSIEADKITVPEPGIFRVSLNDITRAVVPTTAIVVLVDESTPPNWESPK